MASGTAKGCKNYYEKDGQKNYLPGYLLAESLALLTVGKSISGCDTEEKVVNLYSYEAKAEVPTKVQMVMELLNKDVIAGIVKQTVDKNVKLMLVTCQAAKHAMKTKSTNSSVLVTA